MGSLSFLVIRVMAKPQISISERDMMTMETEEVIPRSEKAALSQQPPPFSLYLIKIITFTYMSRNNFYFLWILSDFLSGPSL